MGGLVGGIAGASASVNEVTNNYLQHSTNWRSSQWGSFKEELARCQVTAGCNVEGVYQRWTDIGNDQQRVAMSIMDAMLAADPEAAAEAGRNFGAAAAAMAVSPVDVCAPGDARCIGFVQRQNNQAAAILRAGLVVAYANDLIEGGGRGATGSKNQVVRDAGDPVSERFPNVSTVNQLNDVERATGGQLIDVNPAELRWIQTTAVGNGRADAIRTSMAEGGYIGPPIDVIKTNSGIVTVDHTRAAVALEQGITSIPAIVHLPTDILPAAMAGRFGSAVTWGEAAAYRAKNQRPPLPAIGTTQPPKLPVSKN